MVEHAPGGNPVVNWGASALLVLASFFFVGGEYAVVSMRRSKLESLAKQGKSRAKKLIQVIDNLSPFIAGTQIGITIVGIAMGAFTEPFITSLLIKAFTGLDPRLGQAISLFLVLFFLVVVGELVPKYLALKHPERFMLTGYAPLQGFVTIFKPIIWLAQVTSQFILKPLGIDIKETGKETLERDELLMMIQAGRSGGVLEKGHADLLSKTFRTEGLAARDIMVHRLDVRWIDADLSIEEAVQRFVRIKHSRSPICRGDIDDIVGIAYLHDVLKHLKNPTAKLDELVRPMIAIPENLSFDRIVQTMQDNKTQMLVVMDEYGGTSGIITLEDVVEEIFGELEDTLESERPTVETFPGGRISARADLRMDELVERLNLKLENEPSRETIATVIVESLERVPRPGDSVQTEIGLIRVENMARRRITRVGIQLAPEVTIPSEEES